MKRASIDPLPHDVDSVLAALEQLGSKATRDGFARYGIVAKKAYGVPMNGIHGIAKRIGKDHELAEALWQSEWYEARLLAAYIDDPARVTLAQMDRWCRDFDSWAVCDTVCFVLFDRTPHAFAKVAQWAKRRDEFQKRAAFALIASLGVHDKKADDAAFARCLPLIEEAATDERNFVKKGVSWALRVIGRRSLALNEAAVELSRRLAESTNPAARWIGKDALREITNPKITSKLASKQAAAKNVTKAKSASKKSAARS